jgi:hypothetical protein
LASKLCQTVGEELFFTLHIFLEVGKTQDLPSKIWQTLGDALICFLMEGEHNWQTNHPFIS